MNIYVFLSFSSIYRYIFNNKISGQLNEDMIALYLDNIPEGKYDFLNEI